MNWLDQLLNAANGSPQEAPPTPRAVRKPRPKPVRFFRQIRPQVGSDPGESETCYYVVEDGVVTLTNEHGTPIASKSDKPMRHTLRETDVPVTIAHWLACEKSREGGSDFNRRLSYGPAGVA